jgi:hypothetical protein
VGCGEADDIVSGRSHDRQRATLTTATGQLHVPSAFSTAPAARIIAWLSGFTSGDDVGD